MAGNNNEDEEITAINVTPLVDVMLVLLVIFMVTTSYIVNKSLNIQLPKMESSSVSTVSKSIEFSLDSKAQLYLDGKPISYESLSSEIAQKRKEFQEKFGQSTLQALVSADLKTPHGKVIELIDKIKSFGIEDFAINVETGESKSTS